MNFGVGLKRDGKKAQSRVGYARIKIPRSTGMHRGRLVNRFAQSRSRAWGTFGGGDDVPQCLEGTDLAKVERSSIAIVRT